MADVINPPHSNSEDNPSGWSSMNRDSENPNRDSPKVNQLNDQQPISNPNHCILELVCCSAPSETSWYNHHSAISPLFWHCSNDLEWFMSGEPTVNPPVNPALSGWKCCLNIIVQLISLFISMYIYGSPVALLDNPTAVILKLRKGTAILPHQPETLCIVKLGNPPLWTRPNGFILNWTHLRWRLKRFMIQYHRSFCPIWPQLVLWLNHPTIWLHHSWSLLSSLPLKGRIAIPTNSQQPLKYLLLVGGSTPLKNISRPTIPNLGENHK